GWRSGSKNVTEAWGKARQTGRFTDVSFIIGCEDVKQIFHAHKCVLAFGSPVFEAMFYGPMQEKNNPITIVGMNPAAFENLLRCLYAETIHLEDESCAFDTYEAAERYDVPQLGIECEEYISRVVNYKTVWTILTKALFFNMYKAKDASLNFISKNAQKLLLSKEFKNVTLEAVQKILQCRRLEISEYKLLHALTEWAIANKENGSLKELLKEIHFDKISAGDFCKFTEDYPDVFSTTDALALMKHIQNPIYKKPDWCSSIFIREATEEIIFDVHESNAGISVFQGSNTVRSGIRSALNIVTLAPAFYSRSGFQGYNTGRMEYIRL
ncbi:BTB/POZ domain-containing protein 2-like, partial [Stegodyphus dumicola]|uniref:BTB/POZ domain-containing protein 2-like n=1 Tax=Stegodyphus dumicola TaxID=202533 RepID=UPI0015B325B0